MCRFSHAAVFVLLLPPLLLADEYDKGWEAYRKKDYDRALAHFSAAIKASPRSSGGYFGRGAAYQGKELHDKAIADFSEAIRLFPKAASYRLWRGSSHASTGQYNKALADYNEALRLEPEHPSVHHVLAWLQATCPQDGIRDGKRAVRLATTACERTKWRESWPLATLAAAKAECGDFKAAVRWQKRAIEIGWGGHKKIEEQARAALAEYERDRPYRTKRP